MVVKNLLSTVLAFGLAFGLGLLLVPRVVHAQETINQASVSGRVLDQQGMVVPGAHVTAKHAETNFTVEATTDGDGRFRFP